MSSMRGTRDRPGENGSDACVTCGHDSDVRLYARHAAGATCEHCLVDSHKRRHGLNDHPYELFVESLAEAMDLRERETGLHSKRVASYTLLLASHHFSEVAALREVYWGSLLHDIGKIGVPDRILLKPGQLTDDEWQVMRQHPADGHALLKKLPYLAMASEIVLCHEERYDGSGYPRGLKGDEIPMAARLFSVVDTLDAMTFDRPYRKALSFDRAKGEILAMAGRQFDPLAVDIFLREESALREMSSLQAAPWSADVAN